MAPYQANGGRSKRVVAAKRPDALTLRDEVRAGVACGYRAGAIARVVHLQVTGGEIDRSLCIRDAESVRAVIGEIRFIAERVHGFDGDAMERRTCIFH